MMQEYKREVTQLVHAWLATSRHGSYLKWMTRIAEYLQVVWLTGFESRCRLLGLCLKYNLAFRRTLCPMGLLGRDYLMMWAITK